mgnify:CR=1 FL=1
MKEFETVVGEAIGTASMCWSKTPSGVFDSNRAEILVSDIVVAHNRITNPLQARVTQLETLIGEMNDNLEQFLKKADEVLKV